MEHAIVIKFEGADFFARKNPKRTFELHLTGVSIDQIKAARNDDELFELYKDNHVLFHVKSAGGVSKLTPVSTCSGIAHDLPPFIDIEINQDFQSLSSELLSLAEVAHYIDESFEALKRFRSDMVTAEEIPQKPAISLLEMLRPHGARIVSEPA